MQQSNFQFHDELEEEEYPLYKHASTNRETSSRNDPIKVIPTTLNLRFIRAKVCHQFYPLFSSFTSRRSKSRVLYACNEPIEEHRSKNFTPTYDVHKLCISPNDSTLVRLGDSFEISVVGFCLPLHLFQNPSKSRRLLYSSHPESIGHQSCKIYYDDYVTGLNFNNSEAYAGIPSTRSLYRRVTNATCGEFSFQFKIMEVGPVADKHCKTIQSLNNQEFLKVAQINRNTNNQHYHNVHIPKFLPHVATAIDAAGDIYNSKPESSSLPRIAASISASFYMSTERQRPSMEEKFGNSFDENAPIPLRYGYFILFEKTIKDRVYVNTATSDLVNPLTIFNVPLEQVSYVILRVSQGVTDIPIDEVNARHYQDITRVENLLQLGEAIRIIEKM